MNRVSVRGLVFCGIGAFSTLCGCSPQADSPIPTVAEAAPTQAGDRDAGSASRSETTSSPGIRSTTFENRPTTRTRPSESIRLDETGDVGSDSDEPRTEDRRTQNAVASEQQQQPAPTRTNQPLTGRRVEDGDDPEAPMIINDKKDVEAEERINNGRGDVPRPPKPDPTALAAWPEQNEEPLNNGRSPAATPGAPRTSPPADDAPGQAPPEKREGRPMRATLADLPDTIQNLDKDEDGQIGLYEWPREKIDQFTELDSNEDGFLVPQELLEGTKQPQTEEKANPVKEEDPEKPATTENAEASGPPTESPESAPETTPADQVPSESTATPDGN